MEGKNVFIIGASGGIGGAAARKIMAEGGRVINGSRTKCEIAGVENYFVDVTFPETIYNAVNNIVSNYGNIDCFVYCAGDSMAAPFEYTTDEDMRHIFDVNFFGLANCLKRIIPVMKSQDGGRIIAVSSVGGTVPIAFDPFYSAAKAAVDILIKELNMELNQFNIYLTSVMPGGTATAFSFKRKVYGAEECGVYAPEVSRAAAGLFDLEQNGDPPELVGAQIGGILSKKKPPMTSVSGLKNKAVIAADKIMPEAVSKVFFKTY